MKCVELSNVLVLESQSHDIIVVLFIVEYSRYLQLLYTLQSTTT